MIQTQKESTKKQLQCALKVHTPATTHVDEVFRQESLQQRLGIRFEKTAINQNNTEQSNPTKPPTRGGSTQRHTKPHKATHKQSQTQVHHPQITRAKPASSPCFQNPENPLAIHGNGIEMSRWPIRTTTTITARPSRTAHFTGSNRAGRGRGEECTHPHPLLEAPITIRQTISPQNKAPRPRVGSETSVGLTPGRRLPLSSTQM